MNKILIGIDPGLKNTGLAIKDFKNNLTLKTVSFWEAIGIIKLYSPGLLKIYIEDSSQNKTVFAKFRIPLKYNFVQDKINYVGKIAQNIGENKACAKLFIDYFERNNIKFYAMRPNKNSMTKISKERFEKISKYKGRSSEHSRDAYFLIAGRW